jgi:cytochrome bd ubiquinol oxidase subunit II
MNSLSNLDFSVAFAVAEAVIIALYVVLDGFDLGVGILFPFAPRPADRDLMIETLAPVWDGNETWLVLGGMVLLTAFPGAFAILLPAYYVPLALMLFALVLRGISFEFRAQAGPLQFAWTVAFAGGSALAAFCQGAILGAFVGGGLQVVGGRFAGGPFDWLNLFSIITGLGVIAGYGLLGACWLIWKTEDDTQIFARELAFTTLLSTGAAIVVVSLWTPLSVPQIAERWFTLPNLFLLAPLPLIALAGWIGVLRSLWGPRDWLPFLCAIPLFLASLGGLGASIWPQAVPGVMTIWEASSAHRTQVVLSGALLGIVPIVLAYTAFSYWTFRGKMPAPEANT